MPNPLARLLGLAPPAEKAGTGGTGPGVWAYANGVPLWSASRNPQKLMRQAQALYHNHPWVHAAEHKVSSRAAGVAWHLEDENGDTVDEKHRAAQALALLEKPQAMRGPGKHKMTRRALDQITHRHNGLCGNAIWYKDQRDEFGIPRSLLYINPARMTDKYDKAGNFKGWLLDATAPDATDGVPIEMDEVLHFTLDPADQGILGIGIVESMGLKAQLSELADRHTANVLGSGGRLAGIVSPKEGSTVNDDQWQSLVNSWRNVGEDPNAAKRLIIAKQPIDFHETAANLQELAIVDVAKMSRGDIFGAWNVPESQQGFTTPGGLNSGETKGYDEAVLWQGPVHDRLTVYKETVQTGLLDLYEAAGFKLTLVLEEPEFDDETPLYERAEKAISLPLRNRERREILGLDPFGDPVLDEAVWMPINIVDMAMAPDENGVTPKAPEPAPLPEPELPVIPSSDEQPPVLPAKAGPLGGLRKSLDTRWTPAVQKSVLTALRAQASTVASRVRAKGAHLAKKPSDTTVWWNAHAEDERLRKVLESHAHGIATAVAEQTKSVMRPGKADFESTVAERIRKSTGDRIVGINETTREAVASLISQGFDDGLSPAQVADLIEGAASFNEARAEMIARTESALAYNEAAIRSYEEYGVERVEAIDGDEDAECAERNGKVYSLDEALGITDHPNGTLDWAPVIGKAEPLPDPMLEMAYAMKAFAERPQEPPVVNNYVNTPDVNVTTPPVIVEAPQIDVHIPEQKPVTRKVTRDKQGRITEVTET